MRTFIPCLVLFAHCQVLSASPQREDAQARPVESSHHEIGIPYLRNYSPKEYNHDSQNWAIVQDERGVMYFGNNAGVLEYDGLSWRLIPAANNSAIRSLALGKDGRIYVGAQGELGYLAPDSKGQLQYVSLRDSVPEEYRDFADIAKIYVTPAGVYFQALDILFRWSHHQMKVWKPQIRFHLSFVVRDRLYIMQQGMGLAEMKGDSLQLAPDAEKFAQDRIYAMLPYPDDKILIATRNQGLFLYDGASAAPFQTEVDTFLLESQIYHGAALPNGTFALATLRGGVAIIDAQGNLREVLNKAAGFQDENVKFVFSDQQGGLWLALENGISRAETPSPLSRYDEHSGLKGSVEAILRHRGKLYVATSQGVFYLLPRSGGLNSRSLVQPAPEFRPVQNIATQSWSLLSVDDELLAATSDGVYQIQDDKAKPVQKSTGLSLHLHRSQKDTTLVYVGLQDGLAALRLGASGPKQQRKWIDEGKINEIDGEVRSILETQDGMLWLGTRSQGFIRVDFSSGFHQNPPVENFDARHGLPEDHGWVIAFSASGREFFATDKGIFRFDQEKSRFVPDSTFASVPMDGPLIIGEVRSDLQGNVWMQAGRKIGVAARQPNGSYVWEETPFRRVSDFFVWAIYTEDNPAHGGTSPGAWFGGPDGLVRYDSNIQKDYAVDYSALIRRVTIEGDSVIFGGTHAGVAHADAANFDAVLPTLPYASNALRFEFAATSFDDESANQFQYFLEGFDKRWSEWSTEPKRDYTNLPEGKLEFRVRAKNIYDHQSHEAVYAFKILPPWYRSWWAYLLYAGAFLVSTYSLIKFRTRQLQQRSRALERIVQKRTHELRDKNQELEKTLQQLKDTQNQLIMQEKLASLGALTAGIAHEIKNPLNFVNNFAELSAELTQELREEIAKEKEKLAADTTADINDILDTLEQNVKKINEHGKRADSIVRGMLLHSRGKAGEREMTDLNALLDEYVNLAYHGLRAQDSSFNVKIEKEYDPAVGMLEVVPQDLSRVFLNIINNACYAADEKKKALGNNFMPTISVRTKNLGNQIEIRIRDNGKGVPQEIRDKIFNPFFTTKPTGKGTGLGLSISYDIVVQEHKGELEVETEEGNFTEFIIRLPRETR